MKILVVFTGGTIGCAPPDSGNRLDIERKNRSGGLVWRDFYLLASYFKRAGRSPDVEFDVLEPMGILSENMTVSRWEALAKTLRSVDFNMYAGIVITHGTDTLAYTAAFLGVMLCGVKIPVMLVSSNRNLYDEKANGHRNFAAAIDYISGGGEPGVFAAFSYEHEKTVIYMGTRMMQSHTFSDRFGSIGGADFGYMRDGRFYKTWRHEISRGKQALDKIAGLKPRVMLVNPYVGLDYTRLRLDPGETRAVLHTVYHSFTANAGDEEYASIMTLRDECAEKGILLAIAPFSQKLLTGGERYDTSDRMLGAGIFPMCGQTVECAYAKLLIASNLGGGIDGIMDFASKTYFSEDFEKDIDNGQ